MTGALGQSLSLFCSPARCIHAPPTEMSIFQCVSTHTYTTHTTPFPNQHPPPPPSPFPLPQGSSTFLRGLITPNMASDYFLYGLILPNLPNPPPICLPFAVGIGKYSVYMYIYICVVPFQQQPDNCEGTQW